MLHPYKALRPEYIDLLHRRVETRHKEAAAAAKRILPLMKHYKAVSDATGVPPVVLAALMERESGSKLNTYLGNGQSLLKKTTIVPKGRGPFITNGKGDWDKGAIDAIRYDGLDKVKDQEGGWDWPRALYEEEKWNGFGPRDHGIHTGYLWSGTNIYNRGKYVADHQWNSNTVDKQLGTVPIMLELIRLDPSLNLPGYIEADVPPPAQSGLGDVEKLQKALNDLMDAGLAVDGSYGRLTTRAVKEWQEAHPPLEVDGIAGPLTWASINEAIEAAKQ